MNEVFLDLETKKWFDEVGKRDPAQLGVSFVGVYRRPNLREGGKFLEFFEDDLSQLWPILKEADLVVGYNIKKFDYPVLAPYCPGNLEKFPTLDLFEIATEEAGVRLKLNDLAQATLGMEKNGRGEEAVWFYKEGKLDKLAEYCLHDVRLTRDLYDYLKKFGKLAFFDLRGEKQEVEIDLEKWLPKRETSSDQMTLGV